MRFPILSRKAEIQMFTDAELRQGGLRRASMERWVEELSLTPRFDERAALGLDAAREHGNGRTGWLMLTSPSSHPDFIEPLPDGFYRLSASLRVSLRERIESQRALWVHRWLHMHWQEHQANTLIFYHQWRLQPEACWHSWKGFHQKALEQGDISSARHWLRSWDEVDLDGVDRALMDDETWADTHMMLGNALFATPVTERDAALRAAITHYRWALTFYDQTSNSDVWASLQNNLGQTLRALSTGDRIANLQASVQHHEAALYVRSASQSSVERAMLELNLATVFLDLAEAQTPQRHEGQDPRTLTPRSEVEGAIRLCRSALMVYSETNHPEEWARAHNALGSALLSHFVGDIEENTRLAQQHLEAALRVRTKESSPQEWAGTHNNLGLTLYRRTSGELKENTSRAVYHFEEALTVRNEQDFPAQWATIQVNLGNALAHAGKRKRHNGTYDELWQSIVHFQNALRVFTGAQHPHQWSMTHFNLAVTFACLVDQIGETKALEKAREHLLLAVNGFTHIGLGDQPVAIDAARMVAGINQHLQHQ